LKPLLPRQDRYDFVSLNERRDYCWPGGKRLAFLVTTNIEWFAFGAGLGNDPAKPGEPQTHCNYSWRATTATASASGGSSISSMSWRFPPATARTA
jgi:hypothetical protein